jgi:signal transduction histidine kinase
LTRLKEVALRRSETPKTAGIGSPLDEEFDLVFNDFGETARALEVLAEKSQAGDHAKTRRLLFVIVLAWVVIVAALTAGLFTWERGRKRAEVDLEKAYEEIERKVVDRTSQLSSTNLQLLDQIAERIRIENQLKKSREELRSLAAHLESKLEEERTWVAREIHDQLGQTLTSLNMDLVWLERELSKEGVLFGSALTENMNSMTNNIEGAVRLVSEISSELRPGVLDDLGFIAAVEWQAERFQKRTGVECHLNLPNEALPLDRHQSTGLFRIFQEILTNVARHANATKVSISISLTNDSGMLMLEVSDNGIGITDSKISDSRAFGIIGMRERASALGAVFHIEGVRGQGTRVVLGMPLDSGNGSWGKSDA